MHLLFRISYFLVPEIEICIKYFSYKVVERVQTYLFFLFRGNLTNWLLINSDLLLKNRQKWRKIYFYLCLIWLDMVGYFWLCCLSGLCQQIILWLDGVIFSVDSLMHLMVMLLGKYKGGRRIRYIYNRCSLFKFPSWWLSDWESLIFIFIKLIKRKQNS